MRGGGRELGSAAPAQRPQKSAGEEEREARRSAPRGARLGTHGSPSTHTDLVMFMDGWEMEKRGGREARCAGACCGAPGRRSEERGRGGRRSLSTWVSSSLPRAPTRVPQGRNIETHATQSERERCKDVTFGEESGPTITCPCVLAAC